MFWENKFLYKWEQHFYYRKYYNKSRLVRRWVLRSKSIIPMNSLWPSFNVSIIFFGDILMILNAMTQSVCMNLHVIKISSFHTLISMLSVKKNLWNCPTIFNSKVDAIEKRKISRFCFSWIFFQGSFQYYDVKTSVNWFLKKLFLLLLFTSTVICNFLPI